MSGTGPMQLGVAELLRRPGARREVVRTAPLDGLRLPSLDVEAGPEVDLALVVESLVDGIVVTGSVATTWAGTCRRCLRPVAGTVRAEVREVYSASPELQGDDDVLPLPAESLDLTEVVREATLLALPLAPLCAEDCAGPDPERFPTGSPQERPPVADPRWAALDGLTFDEG